MSFSEFNRLYQFDKPWQARAAYARMSKTQALPRGRCGLCDRDMEQLFPIIIDLCKKCADNVPERGGRLVRVKRYFLNKLGQCIRCKGLTAKLYQMNVEVCINCMKRWDTSGRREHIS
jgi:hypothetical protein